MRTDLWATGGRAVGGTARAIADETLAAARAHGNPFWIVDALSGYGRAFAETDPLRAMELGDAVRYAREQIQLARTELVGASSPPPNLRAS